MTGRICATGTDGTIGGRLALIAPDVIALGRDAGDVTELGERILAEAPDAVIHLAAMSSIAECATHPEEASRVNVEGTRVVARAAAACGARLVVVSTDQVYEGRSAPYHEEDSPSPISHYGVTKAEAESVALAEGGPDVLVVRLHLVVGAAVPPRRSGSDRLVEAARRGERPTLFADEFRSPIHMTDACRALLDLAEARATGVLLLGGPERLSRLDIGRLVLRSAGLDPALAQSGSVRDYRGPPRTPDTSFGSTRAGEILRSPVRRIAEALESES